MYVGSSPPNSHQKATIIFLVGNPCKPSFGTGILGGGIDPIYIYNYIIYIYIQYIYIYQSSPETVKPPVGKGACIDPHGLVDLDVDHSNSRYRPGLNIPCFEGSVGKVLRIHLDGIAKCF